MSRGKRSRGPAGLAALVLALAAACGGRATPASEALDRYGRALDGGRFEDAYELMSAGFRARVSRDEFVRLMRESPREVSETARRLDKPPGRVEISAEFEYGLGDTMRLVSEGGSWRIATNPLAFYDQSTPRAALRSFLRAYRLQRWDVMLRFVPDKYRERMDVEKMKGQFAGAGAEQMEVLMNAVEANLDEPIEVRGSEARMAFGDSFEVKFVREDGAWKIRDLD